MYIYTHTIYIHTHTQHHAHTHSVTHTHTHTHTQHTHSTPTAHTAYIHPCPYVSMHTRMRECMCVHTHACKCVYVHELCMPVSMHIMHACTYTLMNECVHVCNVQVCTTCMAYQMYTFTLNSMHSVYSIV